MLFCDNRNEQKKNVDHIEFGFLLKSEKKNLQIKAQVLFKLINFIYKRNR